MTPAARQRTVLIVDDDQALLRLIEKLLHREGLATATAASGQQAVAWLTANPADLMLLDLKLQDMEGAELINRFAELPHRPPFIIITGQGDERVAVDMMKRGAVDYLVKDAEFLQLVPAVVKRAIEQIETKERLHAAEEQVHLVQSVVEQGFSAVLIVDAAFPDPRIVYINPAFSRLTSCEATVIGQPLSAVTNLGVLQERLRQVVAERERFQEDTFSFETADGEHWGEWRVGPVKDRNGHVTHWLAILRDITERKRLEKEILEISDREQRRIGQDLHDGLCQHLAGIELMSQVLERKVAARSKADGARVGEIGRHVREAIGQTRLLARGLSPVTLESEGLMSALQELALNTEKMFHVACVLDCDPPVLVHDHAAATHLYRIAQEAVSNAVKHGKAQHITIRLRKIGDRNVLMVKDDGVGLPKVTPSGKGMGLRIMQYRAGMIGGAAMVQRDLDGGTSVVCSVPRTLEKREGKRT
jgi:PAS domain S-box-containing protein